MLGSLSCTVAASRWESFGLLPALGFGGRLIFVISDVVIIFASILLHG